MAGIAYCFFLHPFWANSGTQAEDGQSDYADQFHIEQYVSDHDEDGDGVNDQTDMLQSTRDYIATKPSIIQVAIRMTDMGSVLML